MGALLPAPPKLLAAPLRRVEAWVSAAVRARPSPATSSAHEEKTVTIYVRLRFPGPAPAGTAQQLNASTSLPDRSRNASTLLRAARQRGLLLRPKSTLNCVLPAAVVVGMVITDTLLSPTLVPLPTIAMHISAMVRPRAAFRPAPFAEPLPLALFSCWPC